MQYNYLNILVFYNVCYFETLLYLHINNIELYISKYIYNYI